MRKNQAKRRKGRSATARQLRSVTLDTDDFARRMEELPDELLQRLLHTAGRPTRRVCRRWHDAYGPLTGGLFLTSIQNTREFRRFTRAARITDSRPSRPPATPPPRFSRIYALRLDPPFHAAIVPKLPAAFPGLHTLYLHTATGLPARTLAAFAPWAPTLTALILTYPTDAPATTALAATLTSLRSLTLLAPIPVGADAPTMYSNLPELLTPPRPLLQSFVLQHPDIEDNGYPAHRILSPLAEGAPHLTRLVLDEVLLGPWDAASVNTLATAWPALASLHIHMQPYPPFSDPPGFEPATGQALMAALAQRTALTSLALNICDDLPYDALRPLRLRELTLIQDMHDDVAFASLLPAVAAAGTLTRLSVYSEGVEMRPALGAELALLADTLVDLDLEVLAPECDDLAAIARLTRLQSLALRLKPGSCTEHWQWPGDGWVSHVGSALSRLTCLHLGGAVSRGGPGSPAPGLQDQLLASLARHGKLREVELLDASVPRDALAQALLPLASTLVRLHWRVHSGYSHSQLLPAISMLRGMSRLQHLELPSSDPYSTVTASGLVSMGGVVFGSSGNGAVRHGVEAGGEGEDAGQEGAQAVVLPPQLRVLVLGLEELDAVQQQLLCAAAAAQDCAVRPCDELILPRPREWDDGNGYGQQGVPVPR